MKKLFGQYQFPAATARGKINVDIKGKLAVYDPNMLNQLYWAQTSASGYYHIVDGEQQTVTGNAATVSNTSPVVEDWGVQYKSTGQQLILVANALAVAVGQYAHNVNANTYVFASGDNGNVVAISYAQNVSGTGVTITLANQLMGYAPEVKMLLYNNFRNKYFAVELNDVTLGSISVPTKLEDFWITDFDGSANADASNTLGKMMMDLS